MPASFGRHRQGCVFACRRRHSTLLAAATAAAPISQRRRTSFWFVIQTCRIVRGDTPYPVLTGFAATKSGRHPSRSSRDIQWRTVSGLRLLIGDDHTLFRHGLLKILEERRDWVVVAEVGDGRECVRQALALQPDVAVLDIGMPLLSGIEATRQIVRRLEHTGVLILSMHADEPYIIQALQAGAKGYLLKDSAGKDLIRAIEVVAAGKSFFSPAASKVLLDDYVRRMSNAGVSDRYQMLSEREREVFHLIAEGHTNKAIADMLSVSRTTIETHRAHILQKLDIHNTAELVLYAVRRGVIS